MSISNQLSCDETRTGSFTQTGVGFFLSFFTCVLHSPHSLHHCWCQDRPENRCCIRSRPDTCAGNRGNRSRPTDWLRDRGTAPFPSCWTNHLASSWSETKRKRRFRCLENDQLLQTYQCHQSNSFICSDNVRALWFSHLVFLQEEGLNDRKWVEQELGKHLDTIGWQIQLLKDGRASFKKRAIEEASVLQ